MDIILNSLTQHIPISLNRLMLEDMERWKHLDFSTLATSSLSSGNPKPTLQHQFVLAVTSPVYTPQLIRLNFGFEMHFPAPEQLALSTQTLYALQVSFTICQLRPVRGGFRASSAYDVVPARGANVRPSLSITAISTLYSRCPRGWRRWCWLRRAWRWRRFG